MLFLIACISLIGFCFILTKHTTLPVETMPFFVISSIIMILYCCAYLQLLRFGVILLFTAGLFSTIYMAIIITNERKILFERYLTPGIIFGFFISIVALFTVNPFVISFDGLTFWGPQAKLMVINQGLIKPENIAVNKSYPPGAALFYYFFTWLKFNEIKVVMARQLLLVLPLLVVFQGIKWKNWVDVFLYGIVGSIFIVVFLIFLRAPFWAIRTLYMDFPVAIFFGMTVIYYQMSSRKTGDILRLIPPLFTLALLKIRLLPLVFMVTAIVSADQLMEGLFYTKRTLLHKKHNIMGLLKENKSYFLKRLISIISLPLIGCCVVYSWVHYMSNMHEPIAFSIRTQLTLKTFINIFTLHNLAPNQILITKYFIKKAVWPLCVSLIFISLTFLICRYQKAKSRFSIFVTNLILFLGSIVYLFGLLLLYLFSFTSGEASYLASFNRYVTIYYLAWALILYNTIFYNYLTIKIKKSFLSSGQFLWICLAIIFLGTSYIIYHYNCSRYRYFLQWHREIKNIASVVKSHEPMKKNSKIYLVWQNRNALFRARLRMDFTPAIITWNKIISIKKIKKGQHNCLTKKELLDVLSQHDYLLIGYADKKFWQDYGSIFSCPLAKIKPLASYNICVNKTCHVINKKPCTVMNENVYLFKISVRDNHVFLKNLTYN